MTTTIDTDMWMLFVSAVGLVVHCFYILKCSSDYNEQINEYKSECDKRILAISDQCFNQVENLLSDFKINIETTTDDHDNQITIINEKHSKQMKSKENQIVALINKNKKLSIENYKYIDDITAFRENSCKMEKKMETLEAYKNCKMSLRKDTALMELQKKYDELVDKYSDLEEKYSNKQ